MRQIINFLGYIVLGLFLTDLTVLMFMALQISIGESTPHIDFWDSQLRFIINLIS